MNTPVLTVLVEMSVFSAFLIFAVFGISMFFRDVFDESNKNKKTQTTRKQDAKQKQIEDYDSKRQPDTKAKKHTNRRTA